MQGGKRRRGRLPKKPKLYAGAGRDLDDQRVEGGPRSSTKNCDRSRVQDGASGMHIRRVKKKRYYTKFTRGENLRKKGLVELTWSSSKSGTGVSRRYQMYRKSSHHPTSS